MKKSTFLIVIAIVVAGIGVAHALTFPAGTYYFDNNINQWQQPQLVLGDGDDAVIVAMTATEEEPSRWQFEIAEDVEDINGYYFAGIVTAEPAEPTEEELENSEEEVEPTWDRTDLLTLAPVAGRAFYPTTVVLVNSGGKVEKKGYWRALTSYNLSPSGTLPVLYINTEGNQPIITKESYLQATYYLDPMGVEGVEAIGTAEKPLATQIKGRGNYSWNAMLKKPYRLKLDKKAALLGMKKSKHFVLLAHADDWFCSLRDEIGFEVARRMNMPWTPEHKPIELVLNGDYQGIYWLAENIRVDADRVNIVEQEDGETDPELITGGWLVEIDNYAEDNQVRITEGDGSILRFTPNTPEELSDEQRAYLTTFVTAANAAIYTEDKSSTEWENYIDIDALARFYVIHEVLDNEESFSGSCYWSKERGEDTKMVFGPVWDFGNCFTLYQQQGCKFIYDYETTGFGHHWIKEIAKFPRFQNAIMPHWRNYRDNIYPELDAYIAQYVNGIATAIDTDKNRWTEGYSSNLLYKKNTYFAWITNKYNFLCEQWNAMAELTGDLNGDDSVDSADVSILLEMVFAGNVYKPAADLNNDGKIDGTDLSILLSIILSSK